MDSSRMARYSSKLIGLVSLLTLISCTGEPAPVDYTSNGSSSVNSRIYVNTTYGYSLLIPNEAYTKEKSGTGSRVGFGTIPFLEDPTPDDYQFGIRAFTGSLVCSTALTGASQVMEIANTNGKTTWGRVDFRDGHDMEGWEPPTYLNDIICRQHGTPPPVETYALCSENDEKIVVICIDQFADNPALARQIFETFKWTN